MGFVRGGPADVLCYHSPSKASLESCIFSLENVMMGFLPCRSNFSGVLLFQCVAFPGKEVVRKCGNSGDKYLSVCKERILIYFF